MKKPATPNAANQPAPTNAVPTCTGDMACAGAGAAQGWWGTQCRVSSFARTQQPLRIQMVIGAPQCLPHTGAEGTHRRATAPASHRWRCSPRWLRPPPPAAAPSLPPWPPVAPASPHPPPAALPTPISHLTASAGCVVAQPSRGVKCQQLLYRNAALAGTLHPGEASQLHRGSPLQVHTCSSLQVRAR